jgi:Rrf2 family protein
MSSDLRLARIVHVLIHMDHHGAVSSSETIARMLETNPVVVRRLLGTLRDAGYVQSDRGPGGGWRLVKPLEDVTLLTLHRILKDASIVSVAPSRDHRSCGVESAANEAIERASHAATEAFDAILSEVTLADVRECAAGKKSRTAADGQRRGM